MNKGFTIIELAIIAIVIGLLLSGLLIGQSLVKTADLQNVIVGITEHGIAAKKFKDEYHFWPGDFPLASSHWDVEAGSSGTYHNGNGDGRIASTISSTPATHEHVVFWQHLSKSGLIEHNYTGLDADDASAGVGIPKLLDQISITAIQNNYFDTLGLNVPVFIISENDAGDHLGAFAASGAHYIDKKLDDGIANSGSLAADSSEHGSGDATECVGGGFESEDDYDFSSDGAGCVLYYSIIPGQFTGW